MTAAVLALGVTRLKAAALMIMVVLAVGGVIKLSTMTLVVAMLAVRVTEAKKLLH